MSDDSARVRLGIPDDIDPSRIAGAGDELLRTVEACSDAHVAMRGDSIQIWGAPAEVDVLVRAFQQLFDAARDGDCPGSDDVERLVAALRAQDDHVARSHGDVLLTYRGKAIRAKTPGQRRYVEAMRGHTVTFCLGPAGTGKTYLAMAMAVGALQRREIGRIVLTRPVVEAGENLGFLPGTLEEKVDPYVRPLYDALFDMMDSERVHELVERGVVEIAPLAYMRGRTLNDAFVILDEAQNTTPEQMKMFLTRLGFNAKFVITGDATQRDLPGKRGGLTDVARILTGVDDIAFVDLARTDVVRHSLVGRIVEAYEAFDASSERSRSDRGRVLNDSSETGADRAPKGRRKGRGTAMSVLVSNDAELDTLLGEDEVRAIAAHVLASEGVGREVEISLSYVDEGEMRELNNEWRGIDRTTDVLSFECDSPFDEDIPLDEVLELGDIILAPEVIARQAPGFGNAPADECRLMLVHGLLHLLGYDHIEDDEAEVMEAREDEILRELAVMRGEDPSKVSVGPITNHAHD